MVFQRKIEEIRQKPEHQRIRYVWLMVSICMFFLIVVWFFSVKDELSGGFLKNNSTPSNGDMVKSLSTDKTNVKNKSN